MRKFRLTLAPLLAGLFFVLAVPAVVFAAGSWQNPSPPNDGDLYTSGRVGIGTSAPRTNLDVNGSILSNGYIRANRTSRYAALQSFQYGSGDIAAFGVNRGIDQAKMRLDNNGHLILGEDANRLATYSAALIDNAHVGPQLVVRRKQYAKSDYAIAQFFYRDKETARISRDGIMVNGRIQAEDLVIQKNGLAWADYVFEDDYDLMGYDDLRNFIDQNGHLPGVPSEDEISQEGLNLQEILTVQMEKIEELTLYVLDLEERIARLEQ